MFKVFTAVSYFVETENTQEVYSYRYLEHKKSLTSQSVLSPFDLFMNQPVEKCICVTRTKLTSFRKRETGKQVNSFRSQFICS